MGRNSAVVGAVDEIGQPALGFTVYECCVECIVRDAAQIGFGKSMMNNRSFKLIGQRNPAHQAVVGVEGDIEPGPMQPA